jgi:hypothetical protein
MLKDGVLNRPNIHGSIVSLDRPEVTPAVVVLDCRPSSRLRQMRKRIVAAKPVAFL